MINIDSATVKSEIALRRAEQSKQSVSTHPCGMTRQDPASRCPSCAVIRFDSIESPVFEFPAQHLPVRRRHTGSCLSDHLFRHMHRIGPPV